MGFKVGDKVRVKKWKEIEKTLDIERECHGVYFNDEMECLCGKIIELSESGICDARAFWCNENRWFWVEEWLEPIETAEKKEKEPMKMEKVVVVRGMNAQQVRKYLGSLPKSIETVEMPRRVWDICADIFNKHKNEETSFYLKNNTTVAITKDGRVGVARRHTGDTYNINVGRALARARALRFKALEKELLAAL